MADENVLRVLKHRTPLLMVDRLVSISADEATTQKRLDDSLYQGHFPDLPVFPGIYMIEGIAQTSAFIAEYNSDYSTADELLFLMGVENARFIDKVVPPAEYLEFHAKALRRGKIYRVQGCVYCLDDGEKRKVAEATLRAAIRRA